MDNYLKLKNFPQANVFIDEGQEQYETIPAYAHGDAEGSMTFCWKLTPEQIEKVKETGEIWHTVWTFGQSFQPVLMSLESPLED